MKSFSSDQGQCFSQECCVGVCIEQVCNCTSLGVESQRGHLVLGDVCLA